MDVEINDLANVGSVRDVEAYQLPPEAFEQAINMRCVDGGIERVNGGTAVFGTPSVAPHFLMSVRSPTNVYWIYTSLTKAYVFDGVSHTNITRQSAGVDVDYTTSAGRDWNGTLLGGVPILNNGADAPQYWATLGSGRLANLPNWPSGASARVIRAFGPFLVAFDVTLSGTRYPHLVYWSHPADPGSVPSSWDETDPTKDVGQVDLPDVNAGIIRDALPLRGRMIVYKEGSTWRMTPITGGYIFDFDTLYESSGILCPRAVTITPDGTRHVVATQDDIIVHDGAGEPQSILDKRLRRYLQNQIDSVNYINSFMFQHPSKNEVWFCYPENGSEFPTRAIIWNSRDGGVTEANSDVVNFRHAAVGTIQSPTDETWASTTDTWEDSTEAWSTNIRRRTLAAATATTKILDLDSSDTHDGGVISATLLRTGLSILGRKRNGQPIVDFHVRKFLRRVRLKMSGGPINVRVGVQDLVDGPVSWSEVQEFDPSQELWVDFGASGQAISIEMTSTKPFRLTGYVLDVVKAGEY